ncbi:MAG: biotin transporter BioY, partial [Rhodospirillales bacterium]|nr:biotin transporter BioY [Rhodospirillales bacterium]
AALVGVLAERGWDRSPVTAAGAMVAGNLAIYVCGVAWLGTVIGYEGAWSAGVEPFLLGDGIKIVLGTALLPACWKFLGNRRS